MSLANAARKLNSRARRRDPGAARLPPLLLMTDEARLPDPLAALDRLPPGAAVILRHYRDGPDAPARRALARALVPACRLRRLALLIAASPRLAAEVGANGLHMPEWQLRRGGIAAWWRRHRPGRLLTAACHSFPALIAAHRAGADAALLAPVFATASHAGTPAIGTIRFAAWTRASPLPVYALGGVDAAGARRLGATGAVGIAGIGGLLATESGTSANTAARPERLLLQAR